MIRVTFGTNDPQPSKVGKIWYFSSKELYLRVWDNSCNWRVEKWDGTAWTKHERIDQGIHTSPSITDVMYTRYKVMADIWQFCATPDTMALLNIDRTPCGKGYEASARLMLSSAWWLTRYNGKNPIVEIIEVCSTADSARQKWQEAWRKFCKDSNVTSQFNWDRTFKSWFLVRG